MTTTTPPWLLTSPGLPGRLLTSVFGPVAQEKTLFDRVIQGLNVSGATFFLILLFLPAPFGRFYSKRWGPALNGKLSWFIFEFTSPVAFAYFFNLATSLTSPAKEIALQHNNATWAFFGLWMFHYIHRSIIYPLNAPAMSPSSVLTAAMAVLFNICNGYINGRYFAYFGKYDSSIFSKASFWAGLAIFLGGMYTNIRSDYTVFALRKNRDKKAEHATDPKERYSIPRGFFFDYVSCPAYLGEIVEWIGYAIASGSPAAWCFAFFTFSNLFPRAISTHKWYQTTFGDSYPKERKAIIPFIL